MHQPITFTELHGLAMQLMQEGKYSEALALLEREGHRYPEQRSQIDYLRLCLAARHSRQLALEMLEAQLASGFWYGEAALRQSPSLQSLQGVAGFERLVSVSTERQLEAQAKSRQVMLTRSAENKDDSGASPLLLALHGNNGTAAEAMSFWQTAAADGWFVAAPQSSQALWQGAYLWNDRDTAVREVRHHYDSLEQRSNLDLDHVVVTGFSMGGQLATWLTLSGIVPAQGFVAVAPYLPEEEIENWRPLLAAAGQRKARGYLVAGEADEVVSLVALRKLVDLLQAQGIACELEVVQDAGHDLTSVYLPAFQRGLAFIRQSQ
jgi:predicted esterase